MEFGHIRIGLGMFNGPGGSQHVTIYCNGQVIWSGNSGYIAELTITQPTQVNITYASTLTHWGGSIIAMIDPYYSSNYAVNVSIGFYKTNLTFQPVPYL